MHPESHPVSSRGHKPDFSRKAVWPGSTQLAPLPVVMVTCGGFGKWPVPNILTVAWTGIVCSEPPCLTISVRRERYSWSMIAEGKEFCVNLPTTSLAAVTDWCGVVSGRDHDKFKEKGLTPSPGETVRVPVIAECPLALECRVLKQEELGSHTMFLAEITAVRPAVSLLDDKGAFHPEKADLLAYFHGHYHAVGKETGHFGFSVRKKTK